jgi:uncharacterized protein YhaN
VRFERLELPAFGPFSDFALDFSERPHALHIVYGPNEAGKSSLLRALIALLYGVPARSGDAHTHDFARLRIAALLRTPSGELLHVVRRKGLKHTLLDRDERPLAEGLLAPLLGGLDETLFRQMFGLDHERLREGGEALLRGGGHLGEGLFDAGSGARAIRHALEALRAEADQLYKPRGRTPKLNVSVEQLREQRRKLRDAMLSPQAYVEQQKAVADALSERELGAARRRELLLEQARLLRQLALFPLLAQHAALTLERARLRAVLAERRGGTLTEGAELEQELRTLAQRLATLHAFRAEEPERTAELAALQREVEALRLRLGPVARLAGELDTPARTRLRRFAEEERTLTRDAEEHSLRLLEDGERLARARARLLELSPAVRDEAALGELVERTEQASTAAALARLEGELARELGTFGRAIAQCGLAQVEAAAPGWVGALAQLSLPSDALVHELEGAHESCEREARRLDDADKKLAAQRVAALARRSELLAPGELATEADLERAHEQRQRALTALVEAWRAGSAFDGELLSGYERALLASDELASRMRAEAHRYAELCRIDRELAQLEQERERLERAREALRTQRASATAELASLLRALGFVQPLHVRELRGKLSKLGELVTRAERIAVLTLERERLAADAQRQLASIRTVAGVAAPGNDVGEVAATLASALSEARAKLLGLREQKSVVRHLEVQRDELAGAIAISSARLGAVREQQAALRARFAAELSRHELAAELAADELLACIDELTELAHKQREIELRRERSLQMQRFERELRHDLERVAELCALDVKELSLVRALEALASVQQSSRDAQQALERTRGELEKLERQLGTLGDGATLEQLHAAVRDFDPDLGRARKAELDRELEQLADQLREVDQRLGGLRAGLARLEEPSSAIELAEQSECELASARALARRYLEVRLALALLTREIERYRSEHQGPVLARASQLFPRLTLGRYVALEVDYDERDEPVLACVQRSGKRVQVAGLSDGTRDQLYLALRVASIERFLESNQPLPLILDDAFVHFDDARAEAALSVLAELAQRTQVLFFTHHGRMVELAHRALGRERAVIHHLAGDAELSFRDHGPLFA